MSTMPPVFSPGGKYIFYLLQDYKNSKSIAFVSDTETGEVKRSTTYEHIGSVVFSPDGLWFVYTAVKEGRFFLVKSGFGWISGEDKKSPEYDMLFSIVLSPDGRHIAYIVEDPTHRAKKEGKTSVVIADAELNIQKQGEYYDAVTEPVFSADRKEVVYKALSGGEFVLKVEKLD